jgi:hypothetical protein
MAQAATAQLHDAIDCHRLDVVDPGAGVLDGDRHDATLVTCDADRFAQHHVQYATRWNDCERMTAWPLGIFSLQSWHLWFMAVTPSRV